MKMKSIFEVILYLIQIGFEKEVVVLSEEEIRVVKHRMIKREHRNDIMSTLLPEFSRIIRRGEKMQEVEKNEDLLP
ncbi:hypothetical protein K3V98_14760, partial [Listeria monocytogenes]|nr:hypothetical protein [Listeria monocytogenes]